MDQMQALNDMRSYVARGEWDKAYEEASNMMAWLRGGNYCPEDRETVIVECRALINRKLAAKA